MAEKIQAALTYAQNRELEALDDEFADDDVDQIFDYIEHFIDTYEDHFESGKINLYAVAAYPRLAEGSAQTAFILINLTGQAIVELNAKLHVSVEDFGLTFDDLDWHVPSDFLGRWGDHYAIMIVDNLTMHGTPTKAAYSLDDLTLEVSDVTVRYAEN